MRADRIGEADMGGNTILEEGARAALGQVDVLIDDHDVPRSDLLTHRAYGGEADDVCCA